MQNVTEISGCTVWVSTNVWSRIEIACFLL